MKIGPKKRGRNLLTDGGNLHAHRSLDDFSRDPQGDVALKVFGVPEVDEHCVVHVLCLSLGLDQQLPLDGVAGERTLGLNADVDHSQALGGHHEGGVGAAVGFHSDFARQLRRIKH